MPLLDEVLDAHGGRERWHAVGEIRARVRTGGLLPRTRFPRGALADYELRVLVDEPVASMTPFPEPRHRGIFDRGRVRIEDDSGAMVAERSHPRAWFGGLRGVRRNLRWDPLDTAYFAGYAMWNYLTTPLLLTREGIEVREGEPWDGDGERWKRLDVTFPAGLDTHSRQQSFYVDGTGMVRRHDYTAEVVSRLANAAHYCAEHRDFAGLVFPTRRQVLPRRRNNRSLPRPTLVRLELDEIEPRPPA